MQIDNAIICVASVVLHNDPYIINHSVSQVSQTFCFMANPKLNDCSAHIVLSVKVTVY